MRRAITLGVCDLVSYLCNVCAAAMTLNMIARAEQDIRGVNRLKNKRPRQVDSQSESQLSDDFDDEDSLVVDMEAPSAVKALAKAKELAAAESLLRLQSDDKDQDEVRRDDLVNDPSYIPSGQKSSVKPRGRKGT